MASEPNNKRRRMSESTSGDGDQGGEDASMEEKTVTTSKCKGATTIPIFLKSKFVLLLVVL